MSIIGQNTGDLSRQGQRGTPNPGEVNPLHIEEYGNEVEGTIIKESMMRTFVNMKTVRGTDTITNDRLGESTLQKVVPGVMPESHTTEFSNVSLKVDTVILARANQALIDDFQEHYSTRMEVGKEHGKKLGKFFDESLLIQGIKSAHVKVKDSAGNGTDGNPAPAGAVYAPPGWQDGTIITMDAAGDDLNGDKLFSKLEDLMEQVEKKDVDIVDGAIFVDPTYYKTLLRSENLINADFTVPDGMGSSVTRTLPTIGGCRVYKTNRIRTAAIVSGDGNGGDQGTDNHFLSNPGNGYAYNIKTLESDCVALFMMPKAIMAGETIPIQSDVYWEKPALQWYIDSYMSFGATPNRYEYAAVVNKFRA